MPYYDLFCKDCGAELEDAQRPSGQFGLCDCGAPLCMRPFVFATDVCGSTQTSGVLDVTWTSTREREAKMKAMGYEPCGDKVRGARNESHLRLGKKFSYRDQKTRK